MYCPTELSAVEYNSNPDLKILFIFVSRNFHYLPSTAKYIIRLIFALFFLLISTNLYFCKNTCTQLKLTVVCSSDYCIPLFEFEKQVLMVF